MRTLLPRNAYNFRPENNLYNPFPYLADLAMNPFDIDVLRFCAVSYVGLAVGPDQDLLAWPVITREVHPDALLVNYSLIAIAKCILWMKKIISEAKHEHYRPDARLQVQQGKAKELHTMNCPIGSHKGKTQVLTSTTSVLQA